MRSKISLLVLSAVAAFGTSAANADPTVTVRSEVVSYGDLRLISSVGAAVLYGRIRAAAERACGVSVDRRPVGNETRLRACVNEAVANAVATVSEPQLTQYHDMKRKRANPTAPTAPDGTTVANSR